MESNITELENFRKAKEAENSIDKFKERIIIDAKKEMLEDCGEIDDHIINDINMVIDRLANDYPPILDLTPVEITMAADLFRLKGKQPVIQTYTSVLYPPRERFVLYETTDELIEEMKKSRFLCQGCGEPSKASFMCDPHYDDVEPCGFDMTKTDFDIDKLDCYMVKEAFIHRPHSSYNMPSIRLESIEQKQ